MKQYQTVWMGLGVVLLLIIAGVHLLTAGEAYSDAAYKGVLFVVSSIGALLAAGALASGRWAWGWRLALLVAASTFIGYVLSRTVGLPGLEAEPDAWFEPLGFTSLIAEAVLIGLAGAALAQRRSLAERS